MGTIAFVVMSGYNQRAVMAACRALPSAQLLIVARGEADPIQLTAYRKHVRATIDARRLDVTELVTILKQLRARAGAERLVILPTAEYLNRFLLHHRLELECSAGCVVPLCDENVYLAISDKSRFGALARSAGIALPQEYPTVEIVEWPFVAKPRTEFNASGKRCYPYIIQSRCDLRQFRAREDERDYYYQEYVGGRSYYLLLYLYRDGRYRYVAQRNGAQLSGGRSVVFAWQEPFPDFTLVERVIALLRDLTFWGLAMVEVKGERGAYRMIEANPRLWGPIQLTLDSGQNLIRCYSEEYGGAAERTDDKLVGGVPYLWLAGMLEGLSQRDGLTWFAGGRAALLKKLWRLPFHEVYLRRDAVRVHLNELNALRLRLNTPSSPRERRSVSRNATGQQQGAPVAPRRQSSSLGRVLTGLKSRSGEDRCTTRTGAPARLRDGGAA